MAAITEVLARLKLDISQFNKGVAEAEKSVQGMSKSLQSHGEQWTKYVTAPIAGVGVAAFAASLAVDKGLDEVAARTGATGDALTGLQNSFKLVAGTATQDMTTVGQVMGELNTRLGLTGVELEGVSTKMLDMARVTGSDALTTTVEATKAMNDWGISAENASGFLDLLTKAGQVTGIGVDVLAAKMYKFGSPLRQLGFSMEETAAMLGAFEKAGVNTDLVMGSLRIGLGKLAAEGVSDLPGAFREMVAGIKSTGDAGEATRKAIELFGARAGPDMAAAIREGRLEVDALVADLQNSSGALDATVASTGGLEENLLRLKNQLSLAGSSMLESFMPALDSMAQGLSKAAAWFHGLSESSRKSIVMVAAGFATIGPLMMGVSKALLGVKLAMGGVSATFGVAVKGAGLLKNAFVLLKSPLFLLQYYGSSLMGVFSKLAGLAKLVKPVMLLKNGLMLLRGAWLALSVAFTSSPIGWIVLAIGALVAAVVVAYQRIPAFREAVQKTFAKVKEIVGNVVEWLKPILGRMFDGLKQAVTVVWGVISGVIEWLKQAWASAAPVVGAAVGKIGSVIGTVFGVIGKIIGFAVKIYVAYVTTAFRVIAAVVKWAMDNVWPIVKTVFTAIWQIVVTVMNVVRTVISGVLAVVGWLWENVLSKIFNTVTTVFKFVVGYVKFVMELIRVAILVALEVIKWVWDNVLSHVWGLVQTYFRLVSGYIQFVMEVIKSIISTVWDGIKWLWDNVLSGMWNSIVSVFQRVWGWVQTVMGWIKSGIELVWNGIMWVWDNVLSRVWNTTVSVFDSVRNTISSALDRVKDLFSSAVSAIGAIWDTVAGVVKKPIGAMFGWINSNMIDPLNGVFEKFSSSIRVPKLPVFHEGGYTGGQIGGKEGVALLRNDEFVMNPQATKKYRPLLESLNSGLGLGGFAWPDWVSSTVGALQDVVAKGARFATDRIVSPALDMAQQRFGGTMLVDVAISGLRSIAAKVSEWATGQDAAASATESGFAGIGSGDWKRPVAGYRISGGWNSYPGHTGIDLAAGMGTPIFAAADGKVVKQASLATSYGFHQIIDHGNGLSTLYAHMSAHLAAVGDVVKAGQQIGRMGSTGNSTGPHLHFETRQGGRPVDPRGFMAARGVSFDSGGWLNPGMSLTYNGTGKPEPVFTSGQWATLSSQSGAEPVIKIYLDGRELRDSYARYERSQGR